MKNTKSGFSLIELLVVIVIMGILATISLGTFRTFFGKAYDSRNQATLKSITTMITSDRINEFGTNKYTGLDATAFEDLLELNDIDLGSECVAYWANEKGFFLAMAPDNGNLAIIDGTGDGRTAAKNATIGEACNVSGVVGEAFRQIFVYNGGTEEQ